jgi:hypothetical protein
VGRVWWLQTYRILLDNFQPGAKLTLSLVGSKDKAVPSNRLVGVSPAVAQDGSAEMMWTVPVG